MNEYEEAKYEKRLDDARDAEYGERWDRFKEGLDMNDEMSEMLNGMTKEELIEGIENKWDWDECLEDWLQDVYEGEW